MNRIVWIALLCLVLLSSVNALDYLYTLELEGAGPHLVNVVRSDEILIQSVEYNTTVYNLAREIYNDSWLVMGDRMRQVANVSVERDVYEYPFDGVYSNSFPNPVSYDETTGLIYGSKEDSYEATVPPRFSMQAINATSGLQVWETNLTGAEYLVGLTFDDDYLHATTYDLTYGFSHIFRLNKTDGSIDEKYVIYNNSILPENFTETFNGPTYSFQLRGLETDADYLYVADDNGGSTGVQCSVWRMNKTNYSSYDCYVNYTGVFRFDFMADAYNLLRSGDVLYVGMDDHTAAWNLTNNSEIWVTAEGIQGGYMGLNANETLLYLGGNDEPPDFHILDASNGSTIATITGVFASGIDAYFSYPIVVVNSTTYDVAQALLPTSGGGGGSATPPPTPDEDQDEDPQGEDEQLEEELSPVEEFLNEFFPSRIDRNATISAFPQTVYISRYNEYGELGVSNQLNTPANYTIVLVGTSLEGLKPFNNQTSYSLEVPARQSLDGNKRFVQYAIPFESYEEGTYKATFNLLNSNGSVIDTTTPTIIIEDNWLSRFIGGLQTRLFGAFSLLTLILLIIAVIIIGYAISKVPRVSASKGASR